jgi:hypothetical protein
MNYLIVSKKLKEISKNNNSVSLRQCQAKPETIKLNYNKLLQENKLIFFIRR